MWNSGHHDSSTKAVLLCTADKLQCCHMLTCWTQHTQPSPTFIQHSFEQWVQLSYQVLSFENCHWAGLGRILGRCLRNHRKTLMSSAYLFLFPWEGFPWQTCKNHLRRNKECEFRKWHLNDPLTAIIMGVCKIVFAWCHEFHNWFCSLKRVAPKHACCHILPILMPFKHFCDLDVNSWIIIRVSYNISFASALGEACAKGTNTMALIQTDRFFYSGHHDSSTKAGFLCTADKLQCCHMLAS